MHFPTWIDLKGQDAVPETVHHVVCHVDPVSDTSWHHPQRRAKVSRCMPGILSNIQMVTPLVLHVLRRFDYTNHD